VVGEGACEGPVVGIGVPLCATTAAAATATSTVAIINTFAALVPISYSFLMGTCSPSATPKPDEPERHHPGCHYRQGCHPVERGTAGLGRGVGAGGAW
jgi:hypothetical protein